MESVAIYDKFHYLSLIHIYPEFPDEESIRQAVLADEFAAEQAQNAARKKEKRDAGSLLKDLIFGKE